MSLVRKYSLQILWFYVGLTVAMTGFSMTIVPGLGAAQWDIFHLGVMVQTGWPLFAVVQLVGLMLILINLVLGIRPSVGVVLTMLSSGPIMQLCLSLLPQPQSLAGRMLMLLLGIYLAGLGLAIYTSAGFGAGPRDGLMIGLTQRLNLPIALVKNGIDVAVGLLGWLLGGPLGVGTVVAALALGPSVQLGMWAVSRLAGVRAFANVVQPVRLKRTV